MSRSPRVFSPPWHFRQLSTRMGRTCFANNSRLRCMRSAWSGGSCGCWAASVNSAGNRRAREPRKHRIAVTLVGWVAGGDQDLFHHKGTKGTKEERKNEEGGTAGIVGLSCRPAFLNFD